MTPAGASSMMPVPSSPSTRPMPNSSSSAANVPGTGSPSTAVCSDGARGREAERAGLDAARTTSRHRGDVLGGGGLVARAPLAHDVGAHRAVRHLRGDVERARHRVEASRYSGKVSQPQVMPSASAVPGMSSTPSISWISQSSRLGPHRREADPAVAHHDGGHAVPGRRGEQRVPGDLPVVVGVDVDEAGRHQQAFGVDRAPRPAAPPRSRPR